GGDGAEVLAGSGGDVGGQGEEVLGFRGVAGGGGQGGEGGAQLVVGDGHGFREGLDVVLGAGDGLVAGAGGLVQLLGELRGGGLVLGGGLGEVPADHGEPGDRRAGDG